MCLYYMQFKVFEGGWVCVCECAKVMHVSHISCCVCARAFVYAFLSIFMTFVLFSRHSLGWISVFLYRLDLKQRNESEEVVSMDFEL